MPKLSAQEAYDLALTLAGEIDPRYSKWGDPKTATEAANILATVENRYQIGRPRAFGRSQTLNYDDRSDVVQQTSQYSTWNAPKDRAIARANYGRYKDTIDDTVQSYYDGELAPSYPDATHYWSPEGMRAIQGVSQPYWADSVQDHRIEGPHTFAIQPSLYRDTPRPMSAPLGQVDQIALTPINGPVPTPRPDQSRMVASLPAAPAGQVQRSALPDLPRPAPAPEVPSPAASGKTSRYGPAPEFAYGQPAPGKTSRVGPPSVMETLRGLPTKAAPLPDAVSYGLMAEAMKSRGVMGLDGRLAADQPTSLPNRTAPNVPTPTFASRQGVAANVPTPTFADRPSQMTSAPRSNFAGPVGSFRAAQAPSPMAERGARVASVSVADQIGLPSVPAPTRAPRGVMDRVMDAVVSPAAAATMSPQVTPADRMNEPAIPSVDIPGYTPGRVSAGMASRVAETPAPVNVPAPRSAPARPANDPVAINDRAVEAVSRPRDSMGGLRSAVPTAPAANSYVGAPSVMESLTGKLGGVPGIAGGFLGGAVAGPVGAALGNMIGRQFSGSSGGAIGTGTRSSAADAALAAGWSGFGPMTAAQERAARNAGSGSSSGGIFGGLFGGPNEASSSAIGGRTTSYSDGSTEKSSSKSGKGKK